VSIPPVCAGVVDVAVGVVIVAVEVIVTVLVAELPHPEAPAAKAAARSANRMATARVTSQLVARNCDESKRRNH
jgi:hypothetical protein